MSVILPLLGGLGGAATALCLPISWGARIGVAFILGGVYGYFLVSTFAPVAP